MSWARILYLVGIIAAIGAVTFLVLDRFEQKERADAAQACALAADKPDQSISACLPEIRVRVAQARAAGVCQQALLPKLTEATRFAAGNSCDSGTKRLIAEVDMLNARNAALSSELKRARNASGEAVVRAEKRAAQAQERNDDAQAAIEAAPRGDDGGIECDADCLRRIAG